MNAVMKESEKGFIVKTEIPQTSELRSFGRRKRSVKVHCGKSLTEQSHKAECDINNILKDYVKTGLIRHANRNKGMYDDITCQDFQSAMDILNNAQNMFNELPSKVRKRFGNDPSAFLQFVQDPKNGEEMQRMGILKGNDGLDITGAKVNSPTGESVKQQQKQQQKKPPETPPAE